MRKLSPTSLVQVITIIITVIIIITIIIIIIITIIIITAFGFRVWDATQDRTPSRRAQNAQGLP